MGAAVTFSAGSVSGLMALGQALAQGIKNVLDGGTSLLLALDGDLGTGKTTLAAATLKALGVHSPVTSPTYGLVHPYTASPGKATGTVEILHVDLYRIQQPAELDELGLYDNPANTSSASGRIVLVEWFENALGRLGRPDLAVRLRHAKPGRMVELNANSAPAERIVQSLGNAERKDLVRSASVLSRKYLR